MPSVPSDILSVVMPVYNERYTIREILRRVRNQKPVKEVIIVDDASTDGTRELLTDWIRSGRFNDGGPPVRLYGLNENSGKGTALRTGFKHATGKYTIVQDADLEYNPEEYTKLLQPLLRGDADVVYGSRFLSEYHRVLSFWHTLGNRVLTYISNMFTNLNLTDMETCYKMFRTEVIQGIPLQDSRFGFEPEITAKLAKLRIRIYEVPISYHGRTSAEGKKIGWKDGLRAIGKILKFFFVEDLGGDSMDWRLIRLSQGAGRYHRWLFNQMEPYLEDSVLEIGSGFGQYTPFLMDRDHVTLTDWKPYFLRELHRTRGSIQNISVQEWNPEVDSASSLNQRPESVFYVNGLQKHENDRHVAENIRKLLPEGGTFIGIVAADPRIHGTIDETFGYHRRYEKNDLREMLSSAGFEIEVLKPLNMLGKIGWALNSKVFRQRTLSPRQVRLFDWLIPLVKMESNWSLQSGLSYLFVARRPNSS